VNGVIGLPRLLTSDTMVPSIVNAAMNPRRSVTMMANQFGALPLQDKWVMGLEVGLGFKTSVESLAGRIPRVGGYLAGDLGYASGQGITLAANGKLYGFIGAGVDNVATGPYAYQSGAVGNLRIGEILPGLDGHATKYAELVNSNKPWAWSDVGEGLGRTQRQQIRQLAQQSELIPTVAVDPITNFADFSAVALRQESLPTRLWSMSDRQQFNFLDDLIGGRPVGTTWHHDVVPGNMQLVPFGIHNITSHSGGRTVWSLGPR
jgi:hypothetical protein